MADESTHHQLHRLDHAPRGGAGPVPGGGAAAAAATIDAPAEYTFLTVTAITELCTNYDEVIKGQSNREFLSDFNNLIESAVTLALGHEVGGAVKPRIASDEQRTRALDVIVQGTILEKKLEGTRQEEKMEAIEESEKFEGIVSCMPQARKVVRTWLNARASAREQL